jgi:hypothetical protein
LIAAPGFGAAGGEDDPSRETLTYGVSGATDTRPLSDSERALARFIQKSHYQNMLESLGAMKISARDLEQPDKTVYCQLPRFSTASTSGPSGGFVDGVPLPVMQPRVFADLQVKIMEGLIGCAEKMLFTERSLQDLQDQFFSLLTKNSGTTFCRSDPDCRAIAVYRDPCGDGRATQIVSSDVTDAVFFPAIEKFMPGVFSYMRGVILGSFNAYREKHPDYPDAHRACDTPFTGLQDELKAACRQNRCQFVPD